MPTPVVLLLCIVCVIGGFKLRGLRDNDNTFE